MILSRIHKKLLTGILVLIGMFPMYAASFDTELHHRILNTTESAEPFVTESVIMMSYAAPPGTQVVSLTLENESYRQFHDYEKNRHGIFVLTIPVPEGMVEIRYRLVVDGLWTVDPKAEIRRDGRGVLVSSLNIPADSTIPSPGIKHLTDGSTRFVLHGVTGSNVSLVGDFNRWDPYLTPMQESPVHPGVYSITLDIPQSFRFYRFVIDGQEVPDPENPASSRNGWGETASIIR
jgi:1,4-alpha-glucan branching enzyme